MVAGIVIAILILSLFVRPNKGCIMCDEYDYIDADQYDYHDEPDECYFCQGTKDTFCGKCDKYIR